MSSLSSMYIVHCEFWHNITEKRQANNIHICNIIYESNNTVIMQTQITACHKLTDQDEDF